eukprot:TRINITY_DN4317_c0_g1_i4.p2 TRINITY_DN4317_c0_g1~~TRINITY_DN4317_c0_g1_i4.p2  ORF type:complete len:254 (+),score=20.50 TRINITY_DN4317_c0_g1_i4:148-909(+)
MAEHLASIFGTEKDRVNCPFYFKIGACCHGDRCSRLHNKPTISQTLILVNMYQNPALIAPISEDGVAKPVEPAKVQEHYEDFYEDVFCELAQYGELEQLNVCDNLADHMVGNVYVKFVDEEAAARALTALQGRFYAGRPVVCEFSPVTDFRQATCRQFEEGTCRRGGYCNFMHLKPISTSLHHYLFGSRSRRRRKSRSRSPRQFQRRSRSRSRSRSRERGRRRERSPSPDIIRDNSEERRARIAQWNMERSNA